MGGAFDVEKDWYVQEGFVRWVQQFVNDALRMAYVGRGWFVRGMRDGVQNKLEEGRDVAMTVGAVVLRCDVVQIWYVSNRCTCSLFFDLHLEFEPCWHKFLCDV